MWWPNAVSKVVEEKCLIQYFWCFVWFQGIEAAEGDRWQDYICSQCEHSNRIHAGGQLYWCTFQYFLFCINFVRLEELIRNKDAWNWKLSSNKITRFVYSDWLHWLIAIIEQSLLALPQVREEHIRNCVSVMEDRVRIVPEKMLWLISNRIYFFLAVM